MTTATQNVSLFDISGQPRSYMKLFLESMEIDCSHPMRIARSIELGWLNDGLYTIKRNILDRVGRLNIDFYDLCAQLSMVENVSIDDRSNIDAHQNVVFILNGNINHVRSRILHARAVPHSPWILFGGQRLLSIEERSVLFNGSIDPRAIAGLNGCTVPLTEYQMMQFFLDQKRSMEASTFFGMVFQTRESEEGLSAQLRMIREWYEIMAASHEGTYNLYIPSFQPFVRVDEATIRSALPDKDRFTVIAYGPPKQEFVLERHLYALVCWIQAEAHSFE